MDILLTHGYYLHEDPKEQEIMRPYPPLGILYISAHLKRRGFDVGIFDATFRTREEFRAVLERERPPVVGLYVTMMTRASVLRAVRDCEAVGATVVVGGPDPANYAAEYLERGADIVVIGEGELTLEELLPHLAKHGRNELRGIQGIAFRDGAGEVVHNPARPYIDDLDAQPFPDREAIDIGEYIRVWREHHGMGSVSLITARGCPYTCKWCSHAVFGYTHRRRSVENVVEEVELILDRYEPDMLWYADDVFTIHRRWFQGYHEALKERGIRIPFETISREDRLNEDVVRRLAEMGCFRLWVGSESGSQAVLDAMSRRTDAERVRDMVKLLQSHDIQAGLFIMVGYAGEEIGDIQETVEHLKQANPDVFLTTLAYPIKNTPYYEEVEDRVIRLRPWEEGSDRDHTVAGRHSRRFYRYARQWMENEVAWHQGRVVGDRGLGEMLPTLVRAKLGRAGMLFTKREVERGA